MGCRRPPVLLSHDGMWLALDRAQECTQQGPAFLPMIVGAGARWASVEREGLRTPCHLLPSRSIWAANKSQKIMDA